MSPSELCFEFRYFFMRKLWFSHLVRALIVFPGGFGTLDELFELLTLAQTGKLARSIPIILYGTTFWNEVLNFDALVRHGVISREDLDLFHFADDPKSALSYLQRESSWSRGRRSRTSHDCERLDGPFGARTAHDQARLRCPASSPARAEPSARKGRDARLAGGHRVRAARRSRRLRAPRDARRDGAPREVPVAQLVPGDIVQLAAGDMIPGDVRFVLTKDLFVIQGSLTGESLFQTGWFVESLLTQTLIIHIIRTNKIPFFQSMPSRSLMIVSAAIMALGVPCLSRPSAAISASPICRRCTFSTSR